MDGRFRGNTVEVDLEIISPIESKIRRTLAVGVDTGFTGDLCMTYQQAFPLALTLIGVQDYSIADGTKVTFFECLGLVNFGGKEVTCSISIRPDGSLLMGVSLLRKLGKKMEIDFVNETVKFVDTQIVKGKDVKLVTSK